jgi:hypothetical protein
MRDAGGHATPYAARITSNAELVKPKGEVCVPTEGAFTQTNNELHTSVRWLLSATAGHTQNTMDSKAIRETLPSL